MNKDVNTIAKLAKSVNTDSERLRTKLYRNTLISFVAYHVPIGIGYLALWLGRANYQYQQLNWFYFAVLFSVLSYLVMIRFWSNVDRQFANKITLLQVFVWGFLYIAWVLILEDLRHFGLISAIVVFTLVFSYGVLKYSIGLTIVFVMAHTAISYYAISVLNQPGDFINELINSTHLLLVYIFLAFMGYRVVKQKKGLIKAKIETQEARQELQQAFSELQVAADSDYLTGLLNRRSMYQKVSEEKERCKRSTGSFVIAMIDIDHFKSINDNFGHDFGDLVLKDVAQRITKATRAVDFICRWGGEEFLVVFSDIALEDGLTAANKLKQLVEGESYTQQQNSVNLSISIGLVELTGKDAVEQKITEADVLLYQAKNLGRNRIEWQLKE